LAKKWNARVDELRESLQEGSKENKKRIVWGGGEDQVQGLESTIIGFQNSSGDIHRNITKLEQKLK